MPLGFGILVPRPGIEPRSPAVKARSPNHWTAREFPHTISKLIFEAHVDAHMESWKMCENEFSGIYFRTFFGLEWG